jgi:protein ImuB
MERWEKQTERAGLRPPVDVPMALVNEGTHGQDIYACNRAARLAGVRPGARVVDMRAICPELRIEYADIAGDQVALKRLSLWARRWCPWTVVDGKDGLILDTTGADHLAGGEVAMLTDMEARLAVSGLTPQLAIAPTWGAAWALARYGSVRAICLEGQIETALAPLPAVALRLDGATLLLLRRLGLKTVGSLAEVPRLSMARRFARHRLQSNPMLRLDQAVGRLAEPVASVEERPWIIAYARLPEPIQDPTAYLSDLCASLCRQLLSEGMGCRRLRLTVYRTDGEVSTLNAATAAPSRDTAHLGRLFDDTLEKINPGFGFDLITLEAVVVERIRVIQHRLDGANEDDVELTQMIDRLVVRFGPRAVKRPTLNASHIPERAEQWMNPLMEPQNTDEVCVKERPIRLLDPAEEVRVLYAVPEGPPAQFMWRKKIRRVARYAGPERIAPEWWRDRPNTRLRDYFKVEDQLGHRLWLYREGLHEDGRGGDPRWFVHGMFA